MKIQHLPMGTRFEYEGIEYVKTGPLLATAHGKQRLIPKYAVLTVLDGSQPLPEKKSTLVARDAVLTAFARFCADCEPLLRDDQRDAWQTLRADFLRDID